MTTTVIKKNDPSSKMNYFTGMYSHGLKMVSILFIVVLNITPLSSQNNSSTFKSCPLIYPISTFYKQKAKHITTPLVKRIYTFYLAKTFPLLEGPTEQHLAAMDDSDIFDYNALFCVSISINNNISQESMALTVSSKKFNQSPQN